MKIPNRVTDIKVIPFLIFFFPLFILQAQQNKIQPDSLRYKSNPVYSQQLNLYEIYKTRQADVIMLGNSLTQGADWPRLLGKSNVVNMGIASDVLRGYLARVDYLLKLKPKIVFVMGGLNDLYNWTPVEDIYSAYVKLIETLKSKNIIPVIQSTTYAARNYAKEWGGTSEINGGRNKEVDKLNSMLAAYANKNNLDYIDLTSKFSRGGFLKDELTWDGIHFKAEAYKIWGAEVEKVLRKYKL